MKIQNLKINNENNCITVCDGAIVSWNPAVNQTAYRFFVYAHESDALSDLPYFDSGKIESLDPYYVLHMDFEPLKRYYCRIEVFFEKEKTISDMVWFETALIDGFSKLAKWIGSGERIVLPHLTREGSSAVRFRHNFTVPKKEKSAKIAISGLGFYTCFINGKSITDNILNTPFTRYDKRVLYQIYEVADLLREGKNTICVELGDGWYNQAVGNDWGFHDAEWRDTPKLLLSLYCGSTQVHSSPDWRVTTKGPIRFNAIRLGEYYDNNLADNWLEDDFDDKSWWAAQLTAPPGGALMPQTMPPIKKKEVFKTKEIIKTENGYIFDFGVILSGFVQIDINGVAGETIVLKYSERLGENDRPDTKCFDRCLRSTEIQTDKYTFSGNGREIWHASYSYMGFRYVYVSGVSVELDKNSLTAIALYTEFENIGGFECSDNLLNSLFKIGTWSLKTNFHSLPTDCPQREKNGWSGDVLLSAEQALLNWRNDQGLMKWLEDLCDTQRLNGQLSAIAPAASWGYNWGSGPSWDMALFVIPYYIYLYRGQTVCFDKFYPAAKKYLSYMRGWENRDGLYCYGLSDWCFPLIMSESETCPNEFMDSVHCLHMLNLGALMAEKTNNFADAKEYLDYADALKNAIRKKYVSSNGVANNSLTALAMALAFEIVEKTEKKAIAALLRSELQKVNHTCRFGIFGSKYILNVLSENGYFEDALTLALQDEYPSWGNWVKKGATTMWEDWEGRESLNHHMFSEILAWMTKYIAGIKPDVNSAGMRHFYIQPQGFSRLNYAKAHHDSPFGKICCSWIKNNQEILVEVSIPAGASATVILPDGRTLKNQTANNKYVIK